MVEKDPVNSNNFIKAEITGQKYPTNFMCVDVEDYQRYFMIGVPQDESIDMDHSQNPIFKKYPDIFLQEIPHASPYFKVYSEDESASLYDTCKVRVFEGFICTLDKLHTYLGWGQLKLEYIAVLVLDFFEAV